MNNKKYRSPYQLDTGNKKPPSELPPHGPADYPPDNPNKDPGFPPHEVPLDKKEQDDERIRKM